LLEFGAVPSAKPVRVDFNYDPLGFKEWDEEYGVVWQDEFLLLASCGYHDILIPYIEKGVVTPDHATPDGHDMYYWAAEGGDPWMMVALLKYLPNVNSKRYRMGDLLNLSLLHVAAANDNEETAKVLLENGIDTSSGLIVYHRDGSPVDIAGRQFGVDLAISGYEKGERYPQYRVER
ncbi:MAG: ankyrin repeat domain-containing protein, partial [Spirochaetaceae bacterium]|nr:ankyrin repeat domain-containing protein [Spirochaetaceae bacterium]